MEQPIRAPCVLLEASLQLAKHLSRQSGIVPCSYCGAASSSVSEDPRPPPAFAERLSDYVQRTQQRETTLQPATWRLLLAIAGLIKHGHHLDERVPSALYDHCLALQQHVLQSALEHSVLPAVVCRKWTTALALLVNNEDERWSVCANKWLTMARRIPADTLASNEEWTAAHRKLIVLGFSQRNAASAIQSETDPAAILNILASDDCDLLLGADALWQQFADQRRRIFKAFCRVIAYSSRVAMEWLLSSETQFLAWLVQVLSWLRDTPPERAALGPADRAFLAELYLMVKNAERLQTFPYRAAPLLRMLEAAGVEAWL